MTAPQLDQAILEAMRALAIARQADPPDPVEIEKARADLLAAREARGY